MRPKPSPRAAKKEPEKQALKKAYVEAGNAGHGRAQKRLGEIYEAGGPVKRDYAMALRWYEKARAQGIEVPKPHAYTKGH
ncbi:MAG TPA: hypothetical protein VET51_08860 [Burkholderiales bacterium]|nr:hypothetical protein [Burkholderiales bacterium]